MAMVTNASMKILEGSRKKAQEENAPTLRQLCRDKLWMQRVVFYLHEVKDRLDYYTSQIMRLRQNRRRLNFAPCLSLK
ncbi:hypothetical protein ACROYT_G037988 [Oculina patagonica]